LLTTVKLIPYLFYTGFYAFDIEKITALFSFYGFGHSGMGGSTGFCDIKNRFAIAVTLNKMSLGTATRRIVQLVCSELNVPIPDEFSVLSETAPDEELSIARPVIN